MAKFKVGDVIRRNHGPAQHNRIILEVHTDTYVTMIYGREKFNRENSHDLIEAFFKKICNDCGKIWRSLK